MAQQLRWIVCFKDLPDSISNMREKKVPPEEIERNSQPSGAYRLLRVLTQPRPQGLFSHHPFAREKLLELR